jgi:hypothetical protein
MLALNIVQRAIAGTPTWVWGLLVMPVVLGGYFPARAARVGSQRLSD